MDMHIIKIIIMNNIKIVNYKLIVKSYFYYWRIKKEKKERICNLEEKKSICWSIAKCSPVKARSESLPRSSMTSAQQGTTQSMDHVFHVDRVQRTIVRFPIFFFFFWCFFSKWWKVKGFSRIMRAKIKG